jgi:hypothetical protein
MDHGIRLVERGSLPIDRVLIRLEPVAGVIVFSEL